MPVVYSMRSIQYDGPSDACGPVDVTYPGLSRTSAPILIGAGRPGVPSVVVPQHDTRPAVERPLDRRRLDDVRGHVQPRRGDVGAPDAGRRAHPRRSRAERDRLPVVRREVERHRLPPQVRREVRRRRRVAVLRPVVRRRCPCTSRRTSAGTCPAARGTARESSRSSRRSPASPPAAPTTCSPPARSRRRRPHSRRTPRPPRFVPQTTVFQSPWW